MMENESKCYSCKTVECVKEQYCPYDDLDKQNETSLQNKISSFNNESIKAIHGRPTEKLLHERLRDASIGKFGTERTWNQQATIIAHKMGIRKEMLFTALADEIERYYIPRPRFEDGEPVQGGDEFNKGYAHFAVIDLHHPNCYWLLEDYGGCLTETPIKRPQPKVLDADGVEIKVGDTVWSTISGRKGEVKQIITDRRIDAEWENGLIGSGIDARDLTHKEPDSIERIEDDITMPPVDYCKKYEIEVNANCGFDMSSYIEAMCKHLLQRQREIIERGA